MSILKLSSKEARARWRDVLDQVFRGGTEVLIERNGKPMAAIISAEDFELIQEALDDARADRAAAAAYREYQDDPSSAKPYSEIRADLVQQGLLDA